MIAMKAWAACWEIANPEAATAMAITSSCAPSRRQRRLPRTVAFHELVPDTPNGLDVAWTNRVIPQLLAQLADVHVDRPVDHDRLVERVHVGQELVPGEDPAGELHQGLQQLVLDRGQLHLTPVEEDLVPLDIHREVALDESGGRRLRGSRTAENGAQPGHELSGGERLGHVVVGRDRAPGH